MPDPLGGRCGSFSGGVPFGPRSREPLRHRTVGGSGPQDDPAPRRSRRYDDGFVDRLGGHSLRAGFVTQAFRNGADAHAIMRQTGHATPVMLEVYAREHAPLIGNAVTTLGL